MKDFLYRQGFILAHGILYYFAGFEIAVVIMLAGIFYYAIQISSKE